jgi:hypothetical protein
MQAPGVATQQVTMPSTLSVVGVYQDVDRAEAAIRKMLDAGLPPDHISIIGQGFQSEAKLQGFVTTGDVAKSTAKIGAWVGGIFGLLTGVAVLFVPGAGAVVALGPIAGAVLGAAETGAVAGVLGAIFGHFISKQHIPKFEAHVRAGRYLLVVHGDREQVQRARLVLESTGAQDITESDMAQATA